MRKTSRLALCVLLLALTVSDGCLSISRTPAPPVTVTVTSPLAPSFQTAAATAGGATRFSDAPPATLAAGGALVSANWSGYTFPVSHVTGVQAEWNEPAISPQKSAHVCVWVGIGGSGESQDNLIQIGTLAYVDTDGEVQHVVWYETLPPNQWFWLGEIAAGDRVFASVELVSGTTQSWRLCLTNLTTGQSYGVTVPFQSLGMDADFIVEDPYADFAEGRIYLPFPQFERVTFRNMKIRFAPGQPPASPIKGVQLTMARAQARLACTGPLEGDTFSVSYEGNELSSTPGPVSPR